MNAAIQLIERKGELRVDHRLMAERLGTQAASSLSLIYKHQKHFERFGKVRFEMEPLPSGQKEKYALLNEDQAYFLLSLSRNTDRVVDLKARLVLAFREARLALDLTKHEYLPTYHDLHDEIHVSASGSKNERFVHMNVNRLVNKTVGICSGDRNSLTLAQRSLLVVANAVAANSFRGTKDHHACYAKTKESLHALQNCQLTSQHKTAQK